MQSHIKLHLGELQTGAPQIAPNPVINSTPLRAATTENLEFAAGKIMVQSISNYFAHIALFEYNFTETTAIDLSVTESSYFMQADRKKNTCYLSYQPKGKYSKTIFPGPNQTILITFKSDWLTYKCRRLPELQPFSSLFFNPEDTTTRLESVGITESLYKSLQKMDTVISDTSALDNDGYLFVNSCINNYYNKLKGKNATLQFHHRQADEISSFIRANFTTEQVDLLPKIAERFMVSERNLARLANIAFGMPLHEQVIKLRMDHAKHLLATTTKPIKEIALSCGYKDPHYFSKAFKKHYGESPKSNKNIEISLW